MANGWLRGALRAALSMASLAALATAAAAQHALADPIPPGARGDVRTISGDVREIVGLAAAVAGRIDPVAAALKELGARTTDTEIRIEMSADVLFDFDKADLKREAEPSLEKVVTVLRSHPGVERDRRRAHRRQGHAAYNEQLSRRRAAAVVSWLEARTTDRKTRLTVRALGASKPVAPNTKPDGSDDPDRPSAQPARRDRRPEVRAGRRRAGQSPAAARQTHAKAVRVGRLVRLLQRVGQRHHRSGAGSALPPPRNCHVSLRTSSRRQHSHPDVPRACDDAYPTSTRWTVKKSGVKTGGKPCE